MLICTLSPKALQSFAESDQFSSLGKEKSSTQVTIYTKYVDAIVLFLQALQRNQTTNNAMMKFFTDAKCFWGTLKIPSMFCYCVAICLLIVNGSTVLMIPLNPIYMVWLHCYKTWGNIPSARVCHAKHTVRQTGLKVKAKLTEDFYHSHCRLIPIKSEVSGKPPVFLWWFTVIYIDTFRYFSLIVHGFTVSHKVPRGPYNAP